MSKNDSTLDIGYYELDDFDSPEFIEVAGKNGLINFKVEEVSTPDEIEDIQVNFLCYRIEQKLRSRYGDNRFIEFDMRMRYCQSVKEKVLRRYEDKGWNAKYYIKNKGGKDREYLNLSRPSLD